MRILFMGRKPSGAKALTWCCEQGFKVVGVLTDDHLAVSPTRDAAARLRLPVLSLEAVQRSLASGSFDFDLVVSFVYWRIIREPLLSFPKKGVVNFHPAPLPEYKGTGGYNLAILEGLDGWGVTAHYIDTGIDTGPIIEVQRFAIDSERETAQTLEEKTQAVLLELFQRTVMKASKSAGRLPTVPNGPGRYLGRREMEELKIVQPGDDVNRKIRAFWFPPYSGATVTISGKAYTLVNDELLRSLASPDSSSLFTKLDERS